MRVINSGAIICSCMQSSRLVSNYFLNKSTYLSHTAKSLLETPFGPRWPWLYHFSLGWIFKRKKPAFWSCLNCPMINCWSKRRFHINEYVGAQETNASVGYHLYILATGSSGMHQQSKQVNWLLQLQKTVSRYNGLFALQVPQSTGKGDHVP